MKKYILLFLSAFAIGQAKAQCWYAIGSGGSHTFFIDSDYALWGTGDNVSGQMGDGTEENINTITQINRSRTWSVVSGGFYHTIAVRSDGSLWGWGSNSGLKLAPGLASKELKPVPISSSSN
ncbi:MAG TPA: hypothetical protein VL092_08240, partial [Chitinophagaceae bacterium]|nr:hypothetical protein [Chitinophagaceae bacterium]